MAQQGLSVIFGEIVQWFFSNYECHRCATPASQLENEHLFLPDEDASAWVPAVLIIVKQFPGAPSPVVGLAVRFVQDHGDDWVERKAA